MVMVNGSILVIGGEEGSNGKAVPTIEVLPKPAGGPTWVCSLMIQRGLADLFSS